MHTLYVVLEWLLILAFIGFIASGVWVVMTLLRVKTAVMGDAKRLYEPPLRAGKNLVAAARGVAVQEAERGRRVGGVVKGTAGVVSETVSGVKAAVDTIRDADIKPFLVNARNIMKIMSLAAQFARSAHNQEPSTP